MESLQQLLDEMDSVVCYVNGLREELLRRGAFDRSEYKLAHDDIENMTKLYSIQMIKYTELIKTLNTIVKYNANEQYHEKKLDDEIKWELITKK